MSLLSKLDNETEQLLVATRVGKEAAERSALPMTQVLDTSKSTVLAEFDAIIRLQLLFPFASLKELSAKTGRSRYYLATIMGTAAYKALYEKTRKDMDLALGLPTIAEEIDTGARVAVARLTEVIETTDDGYLVKQGADTLLKARGQGGFAAPAPAQTTVLVDARQAHILEVRERSMAAAREAGPYPEPAGQRPGLRALDAIDEPSVKQLTPSEMIEAAERQSPGRHAPETVSAVPSADPLEAELLALPGATP